MLTCLKLKRFSFFIILITWSCVTACDDVDKIEPTEEGIFINEIFASGEDWIELYNALGTSKDIGGYIIADEGNEYSLPSGTSISANGFIVLLCNDLGTGLNTNFKLSSDGETVSLKNTEGTLIDEVEFPNLDNGQSYARFPDGSDFWEITGITTQGESNGDDSAPAINSISRDPLVPAFNESVVVTAELISITDVASVTLHYNFDDGSFTEVAMTYQSGTSYIATIPGMDAEGTVKYYVEAIGTNGSSSFKPASAPESTEDYLLNTDSLPQLVINEFMASNVSCCPDTDGDEEEFDDWIEIHNIGTTSVNIAGMYLSDDKDDPFGNKISSDDATATTIPAGGYLVLWADGSTSQGVLHLNFSLSSSGEDIGLFYIDGRTIDTYTYDAQDDDISWGRTTDAGTTWGAMTTPTPGLSNN
ncbi:lamin tail domain-containing protein [Reichenbachiella agarivorans]|uniref:Lamin tail domain-containing protein n=1 Tax=Reichenbachiella agarivorans TaxID=2979464 RepID=A0ABY6CMJ4_9BACT|nr:lamin tail domain-containing protein [Reichenbachiella agarivorans]UXP31594.1 lamin tail domain-containing protein [Reichenbachiella agarivorans]